MNSNDAGLRRYVESWRPRPVTDHDVLAEGPVRALAAVLDQPAPQDALPPLWHWLHFLEWPARSELGADGHPLAGHFLPPIPDRRRMFAGGRLNLLRPLLIGRPADRTRSVTDVVVKHGSAGEMAFVTVRSEISQDGELCAVDEQDLVYRSGEDSARGALSAIDTDGVPATDSPFQLALTPDPVLLFRFSALTGNAHRIHYDTPYVTQVEHYPGLVVHGPLLVLLMLEVVRGQGKQIDSVSYRLRRPVFAGEHVLATGERTGDGVALRIATAREDRSATADVTLA
jgi:3-methylfumaryl-CoA hydratase